jgi:hypothetical protein
MWHHISEDLNFQCPFSLIEITTLCDVGMVGGPVFWTSKMASEVMCTVPEYVVYTQNIAALDM